MDGQSGCISGTRNQRESSLFRLRLAKGQRRGHCRAPVITLTQMKWPLFSNSDPSCNVLQTGGGKEGFGSGLERRSVQI